MVPSLAFQGRLIDRGAAGSTIGTQGSYFQPQWFSTGFYLELLSTAELDAGPCSRAASRTLSTPTGCELDLPLEVRFSFGACSSGSTAQTCMSTKLEMDWNNPTCWGSSRPLGFTCFSTCLFFHCS
ncbi:unnamed protein product [Pleuronectes platessa]|uniref:Uncharacterized protein n=1 Tax=Pleuronectes platessa TaxID=8262 RepID=A0A9N7TQE4_PLEPL|nr:unnamed protein product [Pleuronectes platessa]